MKVLGSEKCYWSALELSRHRGTLHPYLLGILDVCSEILLLMTVDFGFTFLFCLLCKMNSLSCKTSRKG